MNQEELFNSYDKSYDRHWKITTKEKAMEKKKERTGYVFYREFVGGYCFVVAENSKFPTAEQQLMTTIFGPSKYRHWAYRVCDALTGKPISFNGWFDREAAEEKIKELLPFLKPNESIELLEDHERIDHRFNLSLVKSWVLDLELFSKGCSDKKIRKFSKKMGKARTCGDPEWNLKQFNFIQTKRIEKLEKEEK